MDKFKTTQFLKTQGFDVPAARLVSKEEWLINKDTILKNILATMPLPLIVKPHDDGCSVMVQKIKKESDLAHAVECIFANGKDHALVEECIIGMELTVGVIGNESPQALPPSQAVCVADILSIEEKFLPGAGENQTPAPLPADTLKFVQKTMEAVYKAVDCKGYARIDCFYQTPEQSPTGKDRVIVLEINSLPGMTPATCIFHQAAEIGIKPMDFIDLIITLGFEQHAFTNFQHAGTGSARTDSFPFASMEDPKDQSREVFKND
jgi:D-alanine-D-alanine ligase